MILGHAVDPAFEKWNLVFAYLSQCLLKYMLGGILRICCIAQVFHANTKYKEAVTFKQPSQPLAVCCFPELLQQLSVSICVLGMLQIFKVALE